MNNVNEEWANLINTLSWGGNSVSPRGQDTKELIAYQTRIDMNAPILTVPERKLNYNFLFGEAWFILSGSNRVADISRYMNNIANYSDNNITFRGAYGPPVVEQLDYILDTLISDEFSRQAVLTIWRQNPRPSKDIPCTVSMQWLIRNNELHCSVNMRSSDAFLGWVYDVFNFSMISSWILIALRNGAYEKYRTLQLGGLTLTAGSQHIYEKDLVKIHNAEFTTPAKSFLVLDEYTHPDQLVEDLKKAGLGLTPWVLHDNEILPDLKL